MARPIQNTPELRGKDARRFAQRMKESDAGMHRVSEEERQRAYRTYEAMTRSFPELK